MNDASRAPGRGSTVLTTKLHVPLTRNALVPRPRLMHLLDAGWRGKLTLVCAPAGFGKTTVLGEWLARSGHRVAWLSLDDRDNDVGRFLRHVVASLRSVHPELGERVQAALESVQAPPTDSMLTLLLNEIATVVPDFGLVLDDYHVIHADAVHDVLRFFLAHLPPRFNLIVTSRSDPPLPLARLRARGELVELRSDALRFTPDEAAAFLRDTMGLTLAAEDVAVLETRTEGWVAGLQLAALTMQGRGDLSGFVAAFSGSHRYVLDYLVEEVLQEQSERVQRFLLLTSVLTRMSGPLCDAVTGQLDGDATLERLERANLFLVPLDDDHHWYRYHHLFATALLRRLHDADRAVSPHLPEGVPTVAELHRRAGVWYEGMDLLDDAVDHGFAAGDGDAVASLIERHAMPMIVQGEVLQVRGWLARLPADLVRGRPLLLLAHGWVLSLTGHLEQAERTLDELAEILRTSVQAPTVIAGVALLRSSCARFRGDLDAVPRLAQQALDAMPGSDRGSRAIAKLDLGVAYDWLGDVAASDRALSDAATLGVAALAPYVALAALGILATFQMKRGRLSDAVRACDRALEIGARWRGRALPALGIAQVIQGEVACERGDLEIAAHVLGEGIAASKKSNESTFLARGFVAMARVCQARGDGRGAVAVIEDGEAWFAQSAVFGPYPLGLLAAYRAQLAVRHGDVARATEWAATYRPSEDPTPEDAGHFAWIRVQLAQSRHRGDTKPLAGATPRLERLLAVADARGWTGYAIELRVLLALVLDRSGDPRGALHAIARALVLAEPEGYVRVFLDEGAPITALLRLAARQEGAAATSAAKLLRTSVLDLGHVGSDPDAPAASETLTERELTILRLMAAGSSDKEIAKELSLSFNTIKWYAQSIYRKLGVTKRAKAVASARRNGVL